MPELRSGSLNAKDQNPSNPFALNSEFKIQILEDGKFYDMRDELHRTAKKIPLDSEMVVFEGCEEDDKVILGGKTAFLSHFCTFFTFNICYAPGESKLIQRGIKRFNDAEKLDDFLKSFDKIS